MSERGLDYAVHMLEELLGNANDAGSTLEGVLDQTQLAGLRIALDVVRGVKDGDRLTIRDRFAAHALVGLAWREEIDRHITITHSSAHLAYKYADAMIAERQKVGAA